MTQRPEDETPRSASRYVITLCTSSVPMPVKVALDEQVPGISVFRSRTVEEGRERFRLHLGYFDSLARAEEVLEKVRPGYPTALIATAPGANVGSLDDTITAAFKLVRGATARLVTPEDHATPEAPAADPSQPVSSNAPPAAAPKPTPTLTPSEVAGALAPQRYAVQLQWSLAPIRAETIPRLGIFRAYSLYEVSVLRRGCPEHGLRLGFFKNIDGARHVADYVRHQFPYASVVPVSYREYRRASELTRPQSRGTPRRTGGLEVIEEMDGPPVDTQRAAAVDPATPTAAPAEREDKPAVESRTREELLTLLGAHELEVDGDANGHPGPTDTPREHGSRHSRRKIRRF